MNAMGQDLVLSHDAYATEPVAGGLDPGGFGGDDVEDGAVGGDDVHVCTDVHLYSPHISLRYGDGTINCVGRRPRRHHLRITTGIFPAAISRISSPISPPLSDATSAPPPSVLQTRMQSLPQLTPILRHCEEHKVCRKRLCQVVFIGLVGFGIGVGVHRFLR
ncbi:hypothetical protein C8R44DRAFT_746226 [Mycena epipterygia]|nr:hypothetical protein C8R44DRAFT_746226 [Mycena epipterygia]